MKFLGFECRCWFTQAQGRGSTCDNGSRSMIFLKGENGIFFAHFWSFKFLLMKIRLILLVFQGKFPNFGVKILKKKSMVEMSFKKKFLKIVTPNMKIWQHSCKRKTNTKQNVVLFT
jgi:hypothetical protein